MKLKLMNMAAMALSALLCLTVTSAWAQNPDWLRDGDTWDEATKTLTVNSDLPNNAYRDQNEIEHVIISSGVTSIGEYAFSDCRDLTSVTIGNSVTSIGEYAFRQCPLTSVTNYSLTPQEININVFESVNLFSCTLYVPAESASAYSNALVWWDFGNIQAIGDEPAAPAAPEWVRDGDDWDDATKTLTVNSNPGDFAYHGVSDIENLVISDAVTSIGQSAFEFCTGLTSVTFGNNVESIGQSAFSACYGLTSVTIPNSVTSIGASAFNGCGLTSVTIGNSVTSIGDYAFNGCGNLTSITIPSSVEDIGTDAFYDCTSITDVYCYPNAANLTWNEDAEDDFKDNKATVCHVHADQLSAYQSKFTGEVNVTFVGDLDASTPEPQEPEIVNPVQLYYNLDADNMTAEVTYQEQWSPINYSGLTSADIPSSVTYNNQTYSVTSIGDCAFYLCSGLTSVTIPNSVTSIGADAFSMCTGLASVTIGNSVTSIGSRAFQTCDVLTSIEIPNSVEYIGAEAFYSCPSITDVYCYPNAADLTWDDGDCDDFKSDGSTVCHVHADQLEAYISKFTGKVNVTFVGNLPASTPEPEPPEPAGYSVSLKEGTEDAANWTAKAGEGEYQALPLEGVAAGTAVTVKYSGTKKVKSVKVVKKAAAPAPAAKAAAEATAEDKDKLICTEGHIHVYGEDAECTAARVAKIIYIGTTGHATYNHGLALALNDETSTMAWQDAIDACSAKNTSTPVTGATWLLASKDQWDYMLGDNGAGSYYDLRDGFSSVDGYNLLQSNYYWSGTEYDSDYAWFYDFSFGDWSYSYKSFGFLVRACLAF